MPLIVVLLSMIFYLRIIIFGYTATILAACVLQAISAIHASYRDAGTLITALSGKDALDANPGGHGCTDAEIE